MQTSAGNAASTSHFPGSTFTPLVATTGLSPGDESAGVYATTPSSSYRGDVVLPVSIDDHSLTYTNEHLHFTLPYPPNLSIKEYKEDDAAATVVFQDTETGEGFQVYATPFEGSTVDKNRFIEDEPSGIYKEPKDVVVDGVHGTIFIGSNSILGDTREVWFIKNGYLYEVTTQKELDAWLSEIMKYWKFI